MSGYIPNEISVATYPRQAVPMAADLDNFISNFKGYAVVEGLAITAGTGLSVSMAAGTHLRAGRWATVAAVANQALTAANATNPRIDAIVLTSASAFAIRTGTAAALPVAADLTVNDTLLALVYVPANATTLTTTNIRDKRILDEGDGIIYLANPTTNYTTIQSNVVMATGITIPANFLTAGTHFRMRAWGVFSTPTGTNNLTVRALYGATVIATTGAVGAAASQAVRPILVECDVSIISATALEAQGAVDINTSAVASGRWPMGSAAGTSNIANITIDSTTAKNLTFDFSTSTAFTALRWRTMTIEKL